MENYSFFIYIACIVVLLIIGRTFIWPIRKIVKVIINSCLGALMLYIVNVVGAQYNFHIGLNWWTIACTGFLGIPGFVLVVILKFLL